MSLYSQFCSTRYLLVTIREQETNIYIFIFHRGTILLRIFHDLREKKSIDFPFHVSIRSDRRVEKTSR